MDETQGSPSLVFWLPVVFPQATDTLKCKDILRIRKQHNKTVKSDIGGPLRGERGTRLVWVSMNTHGTASQQPDNTGFYQ